MARGTRFASSESWSVEGKDKSDLSEGYIRKDASIFTLPYCVLSASDDEVLRNYCLPCFSQTTSLKPPLGFLRQRRLGSVNV